MNKGKKIAIFILLILLIGIIVFEALYYTGFFEKTFKLDLGEDEKTYNKVELDGYNFSLSSDQKYRLIDNKYVAYENEKIGYYAYFQPVVEEFNEDNFNLLKTTLKNNGLIVSDEFIYELGEKKYNVLEGSLKGINAYVIYGTLQENSVVGYFVLEDGDTIDKVYDDFYDIISRSNLDSQTSTSIQNIVLPNNLYNPIK